MFRRSFQTLRSAARARPSMRVPLVAGSTALGVSYFVFGAAAIANDNDKFESRILEEAQKPSFERKDGVPRVAEVSAQGVAAGATEPAPVEVDVVIDAVAEREEAVSEDAAEDAAEDAEENGGQSAAFNPETGEINWDCPCLGGMAHGPCGEEFKEAFACFVYSETEPKGIDCITKFEKMRTCFRQHPEHYKEELYEDDEAPAAQPDTDAVDSLAGVE
ncbi:Mitochondrial intermembrane space import and assembly protein 40 [[Candida] zeylanoides]